MTSEQVKARACRLALVRGFGLFRATRALFIADAQGTDRRSIESVMWLVDRDGVQRELCRGADSRAAWRAALDVLEASASPSAGIHSGRVPQKAG
jgi:hypothetical protein